MSSLTALPFLVAIFAVTPTLALPPRWLLLWLPLFWSGILLLLGSAESDEDWGTVGAIIVLSPIWFLNGLATVGRLAYIVTDVISNMDRGY